MATHRVAIQSDEPVVMVCGDDDFSVKQRARQIFDQWSAALGGTDHEIIEATAGGAGQALEILRKLREALDTLPFFGSAKVIWLKDCNFLGEDRTSGSASVVAALSALAESLRVFQWDSVRLVISATKPDKRRTFFKVLEKLARVESFVALSMDDKDWVSRAESEVLKTVRAAGKDIQDDALGEVVSRVGPNLRALANEIEKLVLYLGERPTLTVDDVEAVTTQQKQAQAFALGEALGERDLPRLMRTLDRELWGIRSGVEKGKSEIGLLYGLVSKVRSLLVLRELRDRGRLKAGADYTAFRAQVERIPAGELPEDRRFNPLAGHPYAAYLAFRQSENYQVPELTRAMEVLLQANLQLVGSGLDGAVVLQQAVIEILGPRSRGGGSRVKRNVS